jgi:hypothetical protein
MMTLNSSYITLLLAELGDLMALNAGTHDSIRTIMGNIDLRDRIPNNISMIIQFVNIFQTP